MSLSRINTIFNSLYFAPNLPTTPTTGLPPSGNSSGDLTKEEIIDLLNDDSIPSDNKSKELELEEEEDDKLKESDEEEPETKLEDEIEEDLKEPTEEDLELVTPVSRREILKAYPDIFKKFPYLEKAYYREQQFTEVFPTIDDAKNASEKAQVLDNFEGDLSKGDISRVLKAVKEAGTLETVADKYLSVLADVDEKAYTHIIGNVVKQTILSMVNSANELGPDEGSALKNAAALLNHYVFGTTKFIPPSKLTREATSVVDPKIKEVEEREQRIAEREFTKANNDLSMRVNNSFKSTIEANIDPRKTMSDYVRRNAVRDCLESLNESIEHDNRFKTLIDKLWEQAAKNDYSVSQIDKIRNAFISKARTLLPSVIKRARNEALRGSSKTTVNKKEIEEEDDEKFSKSEPPRSNSGRKSKEVPSGMSSIDFLMQD